jgi:N-methylhydantoinase B
VEALESELPIRVRKVAIRRGSGGSGARRGGDGIVRELEALETMSYSLITERRRHAPQGRAGGSAGQPGSNSADGEDSGA